MTTLYVTVKKNQLIQIRQVKVTCLIYLIKFILPKVLGIGETNWPDLSSKFNQFSFQNSDVEIGDSWLVLWMGRYSSNLYFSDEFVIFGSCKVNIAESNSPTD